MASSWKDREYDKKKQRRGYNTVEAIDPHDGGKWDVLLADDKVRWTARQGMGRAKELGYTVRGTLAAPAAIFRGIRFPDLDLEGDDWLCYVGKPKQAFNHRTGEAVPPWPNEVFLVFVTDERIVYHWSWYACDGADARLPEGHEDRFTEKVL